MILGSNAKLSKVLLIVIMLLGILSFISGIGVIMVMAFHQTLDLMQCSQTLFFLLLAAVCFVWCHKKSFDLEITS